MKKISIQSNSVESMEFIVTQFYLISQYLLSAANYILYTYATNLKAQFI